MSAGQPLSLPACEPWNAELQWMLTCSSGNHGSALAHAAQAAGTTATIIMPENAPVCKVNAARAAGGNVVLCEATMEARTQAAQAHMEAHPDSTFIPPYNHPHIVAGQGTVALELLQQLSCSELMRVGAPDPHQVGAPSPVAGPSREVAADRSGEADVVLDAVVVPVSGGGLISGIATVIKAQLPQCKVCCCSHASTPWHMGCAL